MGHRCKIDSERARPQVLDAGLESLGTCGKDGLLQGRDGQLSGRLTERNESHSGSDEIRRIALQVAAHQHGERNALARGTGADHDGQSRSDLALAKRWREPIEDLLRPYTTHGCEGSGS